MQRKNPFFKCMSKRLHSGKAPSHEVDTFTHIRGLIYKHVMDSNQYFLLTSHSQAQHFTVLIAAHDKLVKQGINRTYYLIKCQYYWKGMHKDIHKYINNCAVCMREKARTQVYPLQMTDMPDRPFDKIAIDLISDLNISASGNQHILTIIIHLMGWPEAFPVHDKKVDTIMHIFINDYLPIYMCPHFILSDNGTEFKNQLMDNVLQNLAWTTFFLPHIIHKVMENWRFFTNTLNLLIRNCVKRIWTTGTNILTKY